MDTCRHEWGESKATLTLCSVLTLTCSSKELTRCQQIVIRLASNYVSLNIQKHERTIMLSFINKNLQIEDICLSVPVALILALNNTLT